jgi:hypothetical protein
MNTEIEWDLFLPIDQLRQRGQWPIPWTSAMGLLPEIEKLGDNLIGCEIGISFGWNIFYFLENSKNISKIHAIDPYIPYDDRITGGVMVTQEEIDRVKQTFLTSAEPFMNKINFINKKSIDAINDIEDNSLDYIFIDGDHNYEAVVQDLKNYYSKVKTGGIFAGHDIGSQGVQRALSEFLPKLGITEVRTCAHSTWYLFKK